MKLEEVLSAVLSLLFLTCSVVISCLLLKYFSTILIVKRNILTHLNSLLVISITVIIVSQVSEETQYVVFAHWMLCRPVGYVEMGGPYLP